MTAAGGTMADGAGENAAGKGGLVLAMDASAGLCSVALTLDGATLVRAERAMSHGHAAVLPPMIRRAMDDAGRSFASLDAVGVTVGGRRVGAVVTDVFPGRVGPEA